MLVKKKTEQAGFGPHGHGPATPGMGLGYLGYSHSRIKFLEKPQGGGRETEQPVLPPRHRA